MGTGRQKDPESLSRKELLRLVGELESRIAALQEENQGLNRRADWLERQRESHLMELSEAGNMAEASLKVTGVLEAAQKAADIYLENLRELCREKAEESERLLEKARQRSAGMLEAAESQCRAREQQADAYWDSVSRRLDHFCEENKGLRELWQNGKDDPDIPAEQ